MKLLYLLIAPALSLASGSGSGSVTLLDGTPVTGAVVKSITDSVVTTASGAFALGRATGISSRSVKTVPVTSHLTVENGRPRLSFAGMDITGRARFAATTRQNLSNTGIGLSARSAGTQDTLKVYWKGKRLTVLPVTSDTTVTFRIDTAWKDDAGIPWNPSITYGSLFDSRDGQTYRTVTIGSQTWMAENLNHSGTGSPIGHCYEDLASNCLMLGRLYSWAEAMGLDTNFNSKLWQGSNMLGICPSDWHVPSSQEWQVLIPEDGASDTVKNGISTHFGLNLTAGSRLKSTHGWSLPGNDSQGFRILRSGIMTAGAGGNIPLPGYAYLRARDENPSYPSGSSTQLFEDSVNTGSSFNFTFKASGLSLRCLKD